MFACISKKKVRIALIVCVAVIGAVVGIAVREPKAIAVEKHAWGLSFQQEGAPPVADISAEELHKFNAFYCGDSSKKVLYLTFDCGYENGNLAPMLDALKKHNAPATFFIVGHFLDAAPDLAQRMVAEGHTLGNHTYHHPNMSNFDSQASFDAELVALEEKCLAVTGKPVGKFYRPPEGKFTEDNLNWAAQRGYKTILWSLAYVDWKVDEQPTAEKAFSKLIPRTHDGAIVLLHSTSATNAAILDELLTKWEAMGYTFSSLDTLQ